MPRESNEDTQSQVEVVLDIFSGRPNPSWNLSDKQVRELKERLVGLLVTDRPSQPLGLGYRGVVVMNHAKDPKLPDQIRAYDSVLTVNEAGRQTAYYKDVNRVEDWLLDQARAHGYGELIVT